MQGFFLGHTSFRVYSFVDPKPVIFLLNYFNPLVAPTGLHDIQHERPERHLKTVLFYFQVGYGFTSH